MSIGRGKQVSGTVRAVLHAVRGTSLLLTNSNLRITKTREVTNPIPAPVSSSMIAVATF